MEYGKTQTGFFSALVHEKEGVKFALTFSYRKVIRTFAIKKGRDFRKFNIFSPKELAQIDSQPYKL